MTSPTDKGPRRTIKINGTDVEVPDKDITFEELVDLADPGHAAEASNYTVSWGSKQEPGMKAMLPGQTVKLKNGMVFDVYLANRS